MSKRNKYITLAMFFIPVLFILVGLFTYKGMQSITEGVPRVLSLKEYPNADIQSRVYFAGRYPSINKNGMYVGVILPIDHVIIELHRVIF